MPDESLRLLAGAGAGSTIALPDEFRIGREETGPGSFGGDLELSRKHARVTRSPDGRALVLEDLGSTNGTYLNGWRIPSPQLLSHGDKIQVGQTVLEVLDPHAGTPTGIHRSPAIVEGSEPPPYQPAPEEYILYTEGVTKSYGDRVVLHGLDLTVEAGEVVGLLGHNGAGKTTFVSAIAGLRPADAGTILVSGIDARRDPVRARGYIGLAPQDLGIYQTQSVRRNLQFFGEMAGLKGSALMARVMEVADELSLTPLLDRPAGRMSGGEKRRLHTGMAMIHSPPLLILDEPTVGADVRTRQEILDAVKRLAAEGRGIIYSTHYLPEIEELGASVAILQGGKIIARGSIAELVAKHSTQAVELYFEGDPPRLDVGPYQVTYDGSVMRIMTEEPDTAAAAALARLGSYAHRLRGVEIIRPSLDSVYLALTETRYSAVQDVPADPYDAYAYGPGGVPFPPLGGIAQGRYQ